MFSFQRDDHELDTFRLFGNVNERFGFAKNGLFFIGHSIYIIGFDRLRKTLHGKVHMRKKAQINEVSSGFGVNKSGGDNSLISNL